MTSAIPYTITNDSITVILEGKPSSIKRGDPLFDRAKKAILSDDWDDIRKMVAKGDYIADLSRGFFTFKNNHLMFKDEPVPAEVYDHIKKVYDGGEDPAPYLRFWQRLQGNPSWRSVQQLWRFLQANNEVTIGVDGRIIAYKGVRVDYKDQHSGKFDNRPGTRLEMARNKVSDDPEVACHYGFHVGSRNYAANGYAKTMIVAVDPEDVVCIPKDASSQKMRCCSYVVLKEYDGKPLPSTVWEDDILGAPIKRKLEDAGTPESGPKPVSVALPADELEGLNIKELRAYASSHGVAGASKIPGGKAALIAAIREVERRPMEEVEKIQAAEKVVKKAGPAVSAVGADELRAKSLEDLRLIAKSLGVKNIKEPGGKELLIQKILGITSGR